MLKPSWLAVDEVGMLTKDTLFYLSQIFRRSTHREWPNGFDDRLGAMNVLLMGDFPPISTVGPKGCCIVQQRKSKTKLSSWSKHLRTIETVIELVQQLRIQDTVWMEILTDRDRPLYSRRSVGDSQVGVNGRTM